MHNSEILYRELDDKYLLDFCYNNMTQSARDFYGVFEDSDGKMKVISTQYAELVRVYVEVGAHTKGQYDGMLDITDVKSDIVH